MACHVKLNRQYGRKARCARKNETHAQLLFEQCMSLLFFEGECQMKRTYTQSVEEVLHDLGVGVEGLSMAEAQERLAKYGPNKLKEAEKPTLLQRFLAQLKDPMLIILMIAAAVSAATNLMAGHNEMAEVIIILLVVLLNAILGVFQESKAEAAIEALQTMTAATCKVMRDGKVYYQRMEYGKPVTELAVIGDSTFLHSGVTGLINAVYNESGITLIILDNSTTGMTGHQQHPATGKNLLGQPAPIVLLDELCKACGVKDLQIVDAYDVSAVEAAVKKATASKEVSVIIAQRPCVLLNKEAKPKVKVENCRNCGICMRLGCPAISKGEDGIKIDVTQCVGCEVCIQVCPFGAISKA